MNIDEMVAGPELDVIIAKTIFSCDARLTRMGWNDDGGPILGLCYCENAPHSYTECNHPGLLERYSTDIAAAWPVVEKLKDDGLEIHTEYSYDFVARSDYAVCEIWKDFKSIDPPREWEEIADADANTMPLAICRAALKAVQSQEAEPIAT